jgi:DNA-nicking Smr family endonuclease
VTARRARLARPAKFYRPDPDEPLLGHAEGIQASQLRRLRGGRIPPELRIDLHGLRADEARRHILTELPAAIAAGLRCVIVVHGKGLRSEGAPVLRNALVEWLAEPALDGRVLAFAPAQPEDGGRGATYVLLRRRRT